MKKLVSSSLPILLKTVLPSVFASLGAIAALVWAEYFQAFCGISK